MDVNVVLKEMSCMISEQAFVVAELDDALLFLDDDGLSYDRRVEGARLAGMNRIYDVMLKAIGYERKDVVNG